MMEVTIELLTEDYWIKPDFSHTEKGESDMKKALIFSF